MESLLLEDRKMLTIKGAIKMNSSTKTQSQITLEHGMVTIFGNDLEVTKLDLENKTVCITGTIANIKFCKKEEKLSLIKRLFR